MKANEFVKKFGLDKTKFIHLRCSVEKKGLAVAGVPVDINELARLVESHELIKKDFESVEMAEYEYMVSGAYSDPYWVRVKQAITDVESCQ